MQLPFGLRWWEILPEAVLAAGLGLFAVTEPSAARSAFASSKAIGLMVATAVLWIAGRWTLARWVRRPRVGVAVFSLTAVGVLAIVVLPAYDDETVVETLPVAASPTTATANGDSGPSTTADTALPAPERLRSASLEGIDHRASGTAVLYRKPDGSLVVGLEDIDVQPGPDYDVYVVPGAGREDIDGGVRLDDLRGNKGTQYYDVPAAADVSSGSWTVLVWCHTFAVPVAGATPA